MKKLLGIFLSLAVVATLSMGPVGCGKKKDTPAEKTGTPADKAPADKAPADKAPADKAPADKMPADKA